jgi:hypothetical protein
MWEPRRLTTLLASTACYRDSFTFILGPIRTREILVPVKKLTDWELFQSFASELISQNIQIDSHNEADKAAPVASTYKLPTRKLQFETRNTKYLS